jgi:hypothetical protein
MQIIQHLLTGLLLAISISACAEKSASDETVMVETEDAVIAEALKLKLDDKDIWYSVSSETAVNVKPKSADLVIQLLNQIGEPILPAGRHASFPDTMHEKIISELKKNDISFRIVDALNDEWIVWEEKDTDMVMKVIDSVSLPPH